MPGPAATGQRARVGDNQRGPDTVSGPLTTPASAVAGVVGDQVRRPPVGGFSSLPAGCTLRGMGEDRTGGNPALGLNGVYGAVFLR